MYIAALELRGSSCLCCVTPSCLFLVAYKSGHDRVLLKRLSDTNDAFASVIKDSLSNLIHIGTTSGNVIRVDFLNNTWTSVINRCSSSVASMVVSSGILACGYCDGFVYLCNTPLSTPAIILMIAGENTACTAIEFVDADIWVGRSDGCISIIEDFNAPKVSPKSLTYPDMKTVAILKRLPLMMAAVSASSELSLWDLETRTLLQRYSAELVTCGAFITAMEICSDSQLIFGCSDGSCCLREIRKTQKLQCVLLRFWDPPDEVSASPITAVYVDGDTIIVGDAGCRVRSI